MNETSQDSLLSADDVRHVANLARLALTDAEVDQAIKDLGAIFNHIDKLNTVDTKNVEPLDHPTELINHTRNDDVASSLTQEQALSNSPSVKGVYFDVPKVLGESE
mgnify:CR=1 FL=1